MFAYFVSMIILECKQSMLVLEWCTLFSIIGNIKLVISKPSLKKNKSMKTWKGFVLFLDWPYTYFYIYYRSQTEKEFSLIFLGDCMILWQKGNQQIYISKICAELNNISLIRNRKSGQVVAMPASHSEHGNSMYMHMERTVCTVSMFRDNMIHNVCMHHHSFGIVHV